MRRPPPLQARQEPDHAGAHRGRLVAAFLNRPHGHAERADAPAQPPERLHRQREAASELNRPYDGRHFVTDAEEEVKEQVR